MADSNLQGLAEDTAPASDSLVYTVDDPAGVPADRKTTLGNFIKGLIVNNLTAKATPVAADSVMVGDSAAANVAKKSTLTQLDTALRGITGVESGATADQTGAEIKTAYEGEANTNAFTDAEQTKLSGIEIAADVTDATNVLAALVGQDVDADSVQAREVVPNAETLSFTFALADAGKTTTISNAGATTATVPPNSSVAFPVNTILFLRQTGAGACTWTPGAGVTLNFRSDQSGVTNGQDSGVSYAIKTATDTWTVGGDLVADNPTEVIAIAVSDETTALTTGTAKVTFRMPYAFTLTDVRASVTTAPTGAVLTVDINETATTILSTKLTIDATEKTSETAATAAVISDTSLADDAEITIDIDTVGSTVAGAGLKVYLIGRRT